MRYLKRQFSVIIATVMLATAIPFQALAAEPASGEPSAVELTATVAENQSDGASAENGDQSAPGEAGKQGNENSSEGQGAQNEGSADSGGNKEGGAADSGAPNNNASNSGNSKDDASNGGSSVEGTNTDGTSGSDSGDGNSISDPDGKDGGAAQGDPNGENDGDTPEQGGDRGDEEADYTYEVTYNTETIDAYAGKNYTWLNTAAFEIKDANGDYITDDTVLAQYELRVNEVTSTDDEFTWDGGNDYVLSKKEGVVYTVTFGLYKIESEEQVSGPYTMKVKTYTSSELKDLLDTDDQYITDAYISNYYDGTGPFDSDDEPGNDSGPQNDVLRSFDYMQYEINVVSASYSEDYYREGYVGYLILLAYEDGSPIEGRNAKFNADTLGWMTKNNSNSELNAVINGTADFTVNGKTGRYKYVKGYHHLNATEEDGGSAFPIAGSTVSFDVKFGGLANNTMIKPLMWTWTYPNDVDLSNLKTDYSDPEYDACDEHQKETDKNSGKELVPVKGVRPIRISAAPHYNVMLKQADAQSHSLKNYNFNTGFNDPAALRPGQHLAPNYGMGSVRGRYYGFGVTLQLYNTSADKGLKGIEIPQGPITFDVKLNGKFTNKDLDENGNRISYQMDYEGSESGYLPLLWSWQPNNSGSSRKDGRDIAYMYDGNPTGRYCGPSNSGNHMPTDCYNGGNWDVSQDGETLSFTVDNYRIDSSWFPMGDPPTAGAAYLQPYWKEANGIDSCYIGCFSCCDFWVIVPIEDKEGVSLMDHPVTDEYGNPVTDAAGNPVTYAGEGKNGTYTFSINDVNLDAVSISGQTVKDDENTTSAQQKHNDDKLSYTVEFEKSLPGTYDRVISYNSAQKQSWQYDVSGIYPGAIGNGKDVAETGQRVGIYWGMSWNPKESDLNYVYGVNALMKFDDTALYLNPNVSKKVIIMNANQAATNRTYLYAAKPDGSGWDHKGLKPGEKGYDDEMDAAIETDLVYYSSLEELESDGKVCVGILAESRMRATRDDSRSQNEWYMGQFLVKQDTDLTGNVYAICHSTTYWTYGKFKKDGLERIPSRLEVQNGEAEMPAASATNWRAKYTKATYDENGIINTDHLPANRSTGDSLYIIPYTPKVEKYVTQRNTDGTRMTTFDLDTKQDVVDFVITAELNKQIKNPTEEEMSKTTVILRDTLPKGVTYNEDAVLGGTYEQSARRGYHGTVTGGVPDGESYLFTTSSGKEVEVGFYVEAVKNSSGTTSLTFTISDFPIDEGPISVFYSTTTDSGAKNGDKFTNSVRISTTEYTSPIYDEKYFNLARATFQVVRASSLSLSKLTEKSFVDIKAEIGYTMTWQNTGKNDRENYPLFDVLPYNGDEYGTSFNGTYTLESAKLTNNNGTDTNKITDFTGLEVWYTTDTYFRDLSLEEERLLISDDDIRNDTRWSQATLHEDGTVTDISPDTIAFCILAPLKAGKAVQAECVIKPENNEPGDKYVNTISVIGSIASARGIVLNRVVSGLVWYDANDEGVRQAAEKKVAGVKVKLVSKEDFEAATGRRSASAVTSLEPVINLKGQRCESVTGVDGSYEFANLPAGDFVILFMDDQTSLSDFIMAQREVTEAREINNSNTTAVNHEDGTVDYGYINITMPAASEITASPYRLRYEDMGLVRSADVTVKKAWDNSNGTYTAPEGAKVSFTLSGGGLSLETELDGTPDNPVTDKDSNVVYGETEAFTATFRGLPRYQINDSGFAEEQKYAVTESGPWEGYIVTYSDNAQELVNGSEATVTNTKETGNLKISKEVVSPIPAEKTQVFTFKIQLSDTALNGTYSGVVFSGGKAEITVAGGSSKVIEGLPADVTYKVTEVTDNKFDMEAEGDEGTIAADQTAEAAFTNTRKTGELEVTKTVVSSTAKDKERDFSFKVTLKEAPISGEFGDMTFTNGVAEFELRDGGKATATGLPLGVEYLVEETAADGFITTHTGNTQGTISATKAVVGFTNTRKEGGLIVSKKVVSDVTADHDKTFSFTVSIDDSNVNGTYGEMTFTNGTAAFELKDGESKSASGLPAGKKYKVTEADERDFIASYEGCTGTIVENDDSDEDDETSLAVVTNTRKTGSLEISKEVVSPVPAEQTADYTFTVTLTHGEQKLSGKYGAYTFDENGQATVVIKGGSSVVIDKIPIGTSYSITEAENSLFDVEKEGDTGSITEDGAKAKFTNKRKTGKLEVSKAVVHKNSTNTQKKFRFTITLTYGDQKISGTFGDMEFTDNVAHVELMDGEKAVADGLPIEVSYKVTEDEADGFTTTGTGAEGTISDTVSTAAFENTYLAEGSFAPEAGKYLEGRPLERGQFTFVLLNKDGDVVSHGTNDAAGNVYFDTITYTQDDMEEYTEGEQKGYLKDTEISYVIKEVVENEESGYTYSDAEFGITVTLHDNENGVISATSEEKPEEMVFKNTYAAEGEIVIPALKKLLGERALESGQFTFELKGMDGMDGKVKVLSSKTNEEDGSVLFDPIKYTQDDIYDIDENGVYSGANVKYYQYTMNEVIPEGAKDNGDGTFFLDGYTYDGTVYTITVKLEDLGDGTIKTEIVDGIDEPEEGEDPSEADGSGENDGEPVEEDPDQTAPEFVFTNAYEAHGTLKLDAEKEFTNGVLHGGEFTFELKDAEGNVLQSKKNDAAGKVSFEMIAYEMEDVAKSPITYTVSEVAGNNEDVRYDSNNYTVTVKLADNGDGTLNVEKEISGEGVLKFVNEQLNVNTSITLGGVKMLKGKDLKDGQFTFVLTDENGATVCEAVNDVNGRFAFDKITYELADLEGEAKKEFVYGIAEVDDGQKGISYDKKVYTVKVTVTNNGDGTMTATADTDRDDIRFVNSTYGRTGDDMNASLWILLLVMAGGALGSVMYLRRKKVRG